MKTMTQNELSVRTYRSIGAPMDFSPDVISRIIDELFHQINEQAGHGRGLVVDGVGEIVIVRKPQ